MSDRMATWVLAISVSLIVFGVLGLLGIAVYALSHSGC